MKQEIRKKILRQIEDLTLEEWKKRSKDILDNFLVLPEYKNCWTLMSYVSFDREVDTIPLINDALSKAKTLCIPCINWKDLSMKSVQIFTTDDIDFSTKIPQPLTEAELNPDGIELVIVPGIAFDRNFNRLGRGKGFYDRFLSLCSGKKVVLAFGFQILESIPVTENDIPVDIIITEKEILRR